MKSVFLASVIFLLLLYNLSLADTSVCITNDQRLISIQSEHGAINIELRLLKEAMLTAAKSHFDGGLMSDTSLQRKMIEKMIFFVATSLKAKPTPFAWPPEMREGCFVHVRERGATFSLNIYPVLRALQTYFEEGLLRPGLERRIEEELANGFLSSLDRYSSYWNKIDADMRMANREGYIKSIGVMFCVYDGIIVVHRTLPGSPAEKVGLRFRDRIVEIDGLNTERDNDIDLNRKLWGEPGTIVHLKVARPGFDQPMLFSVIRVRTEIKSVTFSTFERKGAQLGLLKIDGFNENTDDQYDSSIKVFVETKPRYVIVDLRDNRGGYIHIVQEIVGRLFGRGRITLIEEHPSGKRVTRYGRAPYTGGLPGYLVLSNIRMICLVGRNTASGGEALASAARDADIKLVGERTYGKGIALVPTESSSGDGYYYTAEFKWLTSRGVCIEGIGLSPDIYERSTDDEKFDPVLERAVEELLKK